MFQPTARQRIWGWYFFDWASQPYNTLLLTFIFAPYVKEILGSGAQAQAVWGYGVGAAGGAMAVLGPFLGALADKSGTRMRWIWVFSALYVIGSAGLWFTAPDNFNLIVTLCFFGVGLVAMEFATLFTNSMLPDLGNKEEISRISGNGWAFGYLGGLIALTIMVLFIADSSTTGKTLLGVVSPFGLDPASREGTRFVGPFTALWYIIFMIPFFVFVREPRPKGAPPGAVRMAVAEVARTVRSLPGRPSLFSFLGASMLYRDALNGVYVFGGVYAAGVLGWSVTKTGIFGIIAIIASATFAWLGGKLDEAMGSKFVMSISLLVLIGVAIAIMFVSPVMVLGIPVAKGSHLPDAAFYILGALIGAAGGSLLPSSRTMMVRQADPEKMSEAFGLYALSGKATSFIAPLSIGVVTDLTASQQLGILPLVVLLTLGLLLLFWVKPDGDAAGDPESTG